MHTGICGINEGMHNKINTDFQKKNLFTYKSVQRCKALSMACSDYVQQFTAALSNLMRPLLTYPLSYLRFCDVPPVVLWYCLSLVK